MNVIKIVLPLFIPFFLFSACLSQEKSIQNTELVGGPCEGCEAIFEYGDRRLSPVDTLPGFMKTEHQLKLTGTIYQSDGKTPAPDIILYIYHTNEKGVYIPLGEVNQAGPKGTAICADGFKRDPTASILSILRSPVLIAEIRLISTH